MDRKFAVYSQHIQSQEPQRPPSPDSQPSVSGPFELVSLNIPDKRRQKSNPDPHFSSGSKNAFSKPSDVSSADTVSIKRMKENEPQSHRLSSLFKQQEFLKDVRMPLTNVGVSPCGFQAAVSETLVRASDDKGLAMVVRLPAGTTADNVAVTIYMEVLREGEGPCADPDENDNDKMIMKCYEETDSKTVFTGLLKVPENTDLARLINMPLYLIDSEEKLVLNPGSELSYRSLVTPSENVLFKEPEEHMLVSNIKIKLRLDKINREAEKIDLHEKHVIRTQGKKRTVEDKTTSYSLEHTNKKKRINNGKETDNMKRGSYETMHQETETGETASTMVNIKSAKCKSADCAKRVNNQANATADISEILFESTEHAELIEDEGSETENLEEVLYESLSDINHTREREIVYFKVKECCESTSEIEIRFDGAQANEQSEARNSMNWLNYELPLIEKPQAHESAPSIEKTVHDNSTQYSYTNFMINKEVDIQCSLLLPNTTAAKLDYKSSSTSTSLSVDPLYALSPNLVTHTRSPPSQSYKSSETVWPRSTTSIEATDCSTTLFSPSETALQSASSASCFYGNENEPRVPANSPSSPTNLRDQGLQLKCVRNDLDFSVNMKNVHRIILRYRRPIKSCSPVSAMQRQNRYRNQSDQTNELPVTTSSVHTVERAVTYSKFGDFSNPESELCSTDLDYKSSENFKQMLKSQADVRHKSDKTLQLLEDARSKLLSYLSSNDYNEKFHSMSNKELLDMCSLLPKDFILQGLLSRKPPNVGHVSIDYENPVDVGTKKTQPHSKKENKQRCYEDDSDEYYERQRRDIRRYFDTQYRNLDLEGSPRGGTKKDFDYCYGGDSLDHDLKTNSPNTVFQVYPLIVDSKSRQVKSLKNQAKAKIEETAAKRNSIRNSKNVPSSHTTPATSTETNNLNSLRNSDSVSAQLNAELETLQQLYDGMCSSVSSVLHSADNSSPESSKSYGNVESIDEDLSNTFDEIEACLSTMSEILILPKVTPSLEDLHALLSPATEPLEALSDALCSVTSKEVVVPQQSPKKGDSAVESSKSSYGTNELTEQKHQTYFNMENEILRTIQELLKESGDIKEAAILNGAEEETEPPFSFEFIHNLEGDHSTVICKSILDDIISSSVATAEETNYGIKYHPEKPHEDVQYILSVLLEEIEGNEHFLCDRELIQTQPFSSDEGLGTLNFLFDTTYKKPGGYRINMQIGDATCSAKSKEIVLKYERGKDALYFPKTDFKIPKTSYTFGETPDNGMEALQLHSKTPTRRRAIGKEHIIWNTDMSRLFSELVKFNLEFSLNEYRSSSDSKLKKCDHVMPRDEYHRTHTSGSETECQQSTSTSQTVEISIPAEIRYTKSQIMCPYKPTNALPMITFKKPGTQGANMMETETVNDADCSDSDDNKPKQTRKDEEKVNQHEHNETHSTSTLTKSRKCPHLTDSFNRDIPRDQPSTSTRIFKTSRTTDEEELLQNVDLTNQELSSFTEPDVVLPKREPVLLKRSFRALAQIRASQVYESSSEEEMTAPTTSKRCPPKKGKDTDIIEIKPHVKMMAAESDSLSFMIKQPLTFNMHSPDSPQNSVISLKPAQALPNIQDLWSQQEHLQEHDVISSRPGPTTVRSGPLRRKSCNSSSTSSKNGQAASDADYEGDQETLQVQLPNPKHRYKSQPELNTPEEIAAIEKNVMENDLLARKDKLVFVSSNTSSQLVYEDSSMSLQSNSELSVNILPQDSGEVKIIDLEKAEPSKSST